MPQATSQQRFTRHQQLAKTRRVGPALLSYLSWNAQIELEQFHKPHKVHTVEFLSAHRAEVRTTTPRLASRAGKHYKHIVELVIRLQELVAAQSAELTPEPPNGKRKIHTGPYNLRIRSAARLEPNIDKVARVLLDFAIQMAKEQQARDADDSETETPPNAA